MLLGERIKNRRKELELSAEQVAQALGVSRATYYRYESSSVDKLPTAAIEPLSKVLRTTPAELLGWEDDTPKVEEDEFTYALFGEVKDLSDDNRATLLDMARLLRQRQEREGE